MSETHRRSTARDRVLAYLQSRGRATNAELNDVCFRYGARILELRAQGYDIRTGEKHGGLVVYTYHGRKQLQQAELFI